MGLPDFSASDFHISSKDKAMDPNETLRLFREAVDAGDYILASEHAGALLDWLGRGGFWPKGLCSFELVEMRAMTEGC